jgi:TolA-binding protein
LDKTDKDKSSKIEDVKDNTKNKKDKSNKESTILSDQESFEKAIEFKNNKEYYKAINLYKDVLENSVDKKYVSESIYQVANLSQTLKKYSDSAKYYSMYIQKYNKEYPYYEESYYNLGLIYYEDNQLEKSKDVFREFKKKLPDSIYNNSKVQEILKK